MGFQMREYTTDIILIENSTAGNQDTIFHAQVVRFHRKPDTVVTGVDGYTSPASHDTIVKWKGGKASYFDQVTDVKLVHSDGRVLVSGSLNRNFTVPTDEEGGFVTFAVFEGS